MLEAACVGVVVGAALAPWLEPRPPLEVAAVTLACLVALGLLRVRVAAPWGLVGVGIGWLVVLTQVEGPDLDGPVAVQGVVVGAGLGRSADLACARWAPPGGAWRPCEGRIRLRFPLASPGPGLPLVATGRAGPIDGGGVLPGAPDPVRLARRGGVRSELRVDEVRLLGGAVPRSCAAADPTGVLCALALGVMEKLDPDVVAVLRNTGTSHILSISGFHVGFVGVVAGGLARALLRVVALVRPEGVSHAPAYVAAAVAALAYTWLAGAPTSAQRAGLLVALIAVVKLLGGEPQPLRLLGLCAVGVILVDPPAVGGAAFQLSFGAMLGLVRVTPRVQRYIPPDLPWPARPVLDGVATSIGATVGTLPAAAWWFQMVPPLSPVANLGALPWCSVVLVPLSAVAVFGPEPLAGWADVAGTAAVRLMCAALEPLAVAPWAPAVGPIGALALLCWVAWPKRVGTCLLISWLAFGLRAAPVGDRVVILDVGQGDAALVHEGGRVWLIDGGRPGDRVLQYLRREGIFRLDVVVATHEEADHVGGLHPVLAALEVGELWASTEGPTVDLARSRGIPVVLRPEGALHPSPDWTGESANDGSVVVQLAGVLFSGDIEKAGERYTWAALPGSVPVLKVPHHGSKTSSSNLLLDGVRPRVAVIGVGAGNRYGHPAPSVIRRYRERGIAVYRTDQDGTIEVRVEEGAVRVRSWKAGRGWSGWARYAVP